MRNRVSLKFLNWLLFCDCVFALAYVSVEFFSNVLLSIKQRVQFRRSDQCFRVGTSVYPFNARRSICIFHAHKQSIVHCNAHFISPVSLSQTQMLDKNKCFIQHSNETIVTCSIFVMGQQNIDFPRLNHSINMYHRIHFIHSCK